MNELYGVASDVHLHNWSAFAEGKVNGVNQRLTIILEALEQAAKEIVERGGDRLVITGDLFHVRGSITPSVINPAQKTFKNMIRAGLTEIVVLAGNHDLESKNSSALTNACETLSNLDAVRVISNPLICETRKAVYIPWYDDNDELMIAIKQFRDNVEGDVSEYDLFIHAGIDDVLPTMPGKGIDPDDLVALGFRYVCCGHYHNHKEVRANVFSVGALTHQTWSDVDTLAGYMIIDGDAVEHLETNAPKFVDYDASIVAKESDAVDLCEGNYIRVKVNAAAQSEVEEMRRWLISEIGAKNCIIQAAPKSKVVRRAGAKVKASSLRESIGTFIDSKSTAVKVADLTKECEDILSLTVEV